MNPLAIVGTVVQTLGSALSEYYQTRALDEAQAVARFRARVAGEIAACLADEAALEAARQAALAEAVLIARRHGEQDE
jgi:hypothetical protein